MKKLGLVLIFVLMASIIPVHGWGSNSIIVEGTITTEYFKESAGYDRILSQDGEVLVESQRWTVEYLSGKNWKQIGIPYEVNQDGDTVTRHYTDYSGTQIEVIYHHLDNGSTKIDAVINSGEDRVYRIVWNLDGISKTNVFQDENCIQFTDGETGIKFDWDDAFNQFGDITTFAVESSANGKKLEVVFNVGLVKQGETLTLDPVIAPGDNAYFMRQRRNRMFFTDAGRYYIFWRDQPASVLYSYSNDTVTWSTPAAPPSMAVNRITYDVGFNGTHFVIAGSTSGDGADIGVYTYSDEPAGLVNIDADGNGIPVAGGQDIDYISVDMTDFTNIWIAYHLDNGGGDDDAMVSNGQMAGGVFVDYAGFPDKLADLNNPLAMSIETFGLNRARTAVFELGDLDLRIWESIRVGAVANLEFTDGDVVGGLAQDLRILKVTDAWWVCFSGDEFFNSTGGGAWTAQGRVAVAGSAIAIQGETILQYSLDETNEVVNVTAYTIGGGFRLPFPAIDNPGYDFGASNEVSSSKNETTATHLGFTMTNVTSTYVVYENFTYSSPAPTIDIETEATVSRNLWSLFNATVNDVEGFGLIDNVTLLFDGIGTGENFTMRWVQTGDVFSEVDDPLGIATLNDGNSTVLNATGVLLSFNITITGGTSGLSTISGTVFNVDGSSGFGQTTYFFSFFTWTDVGFLINSAGEFWGISDIMGNLATLITGLSGDFSIGITNFLGMIRQQLRLVYQIIGWFITSFTGMVTTVLNVWNALYAILDGTSIVATGLGNWWTFIALDEWIDGLYLGILILWIESISERGRTRGEITVFLADVNQLINISSFFVSISLSVFTLVLNNVLTLFDAIMTVIPL